MKPGYFHKSAMSVQFLSGKINLSGIEFLTLIIFFVFLLLQGCASLLPSSKEVTKSRWNSFDEAKAAYDKIMPNTTTLEDLKNLGFNPETTPNITILNYLEVAKAVQPIRKEDLEPGLAVCLDAKEKCRAYEFELKNINGKRYGNFWLDLLNFRRNIHLTGWRFNSLIVAVDGTVTYKVWSGNPHTDATVEQKNPLGPLQDGANLRLFIPY